MLFRRTKMSNWHSFRFFSVGGGPKSKKVFVPNGMVRINTKYCQMELSQLTTFFRKDDI